MALSSRSRRRIALVTCAEAPELDPDSREVITPLAALGLTAVPAVWDDPAVDWSSFDLAVIRSCWDYAMRHRDFLAWTRRPSRLANSPGTLTWNTDKTYLRELAAAGIPVVPTTWVDPGQQWTPSRSGQWVIKPSVSLAALDTGRYQLGDAGQRRLAADLVRRIHRTGRAAMIQPYLPAIEATGETSLVYFNGVFSHAVRRAALLTGPDTGIDRRFGKDGGLEPTRPSRAEQEIARKALDAVPGGAGTLLYARVDLIPDQDGRPLLIELELTEPELFLAQAPAAVTRLAAAITTRIHPPINQKEES